VAPPIQVPLLDTSRDRQGKLAEAGFFSEKKKQGAHLSWQRPAFFFVRAALGTICAICESKLYETVRIKINKRAARYMLFMLATNAGMWNAATGGSCIRRFYV
jgi:hypothetical protein